MSESTLRVVIADDHPLVRTGLRSLCDRLSVGSSNAEVVAEACDGFEAISFTKDLQPNLLLLDGGMPLASGMQVFNEVRRWSQDTKVVVVTGFTSHGQVVDWVSAGVNGLFFKSCPPDELLAGLGEVMAGKTVYSAAVSKVLDEAGAGVELTPRERQILHLLAEGASNKEIARDLSISPKTVDAHRTKLMAKLDVHSVAQLIAYALKEGLLDHKTQS